MGIGLNVGIDTQCHARAFALIPGHLDQPRQF
jgi:hypothetical protein